MDLVKRKPGKLDYQDEVQQTRQRDSNVERGALICVEQEIKVYNPNHHQLDKFQYQDEPRNSKDEAQQPHFEQGASLEQAHQLHLEQGASLEQAHQLHLEQGACLEQAHQPHLEQGACLEQAHQPHPEQGVCHHHQYRHQHDEGERGRVKLQKEECQLDELKLQQCHEDDCLYGSESQQHSQAEFRQQEQQQQQYPILNIGIHNQQQQDTCQHQLTELQKQQSHGKEKISDKPLQDKLQLQSQVEKKESHMLLEDELQLRSQGGELKIIPLQAKLHNQSQREESKFNPLQAKLHNQSQRGESKIIPLQAKLHNQSQRGESKMIPLQAKLQMQGKGIKPQFQREEEEKESQDKSRKGNVDGQLQSRDEKKKSQKQNLQHHQYPQCCKHDESQQLQHYHKSVLGDQETLQSSSASTTQNEVAYHERKNESLQNEVAHHEGEDCILIERESENEGATTLLLLADGNRDNSDGNSKLHPEWLVQLNLDQAPREVNQSPIDDDRDASSSQSSIDDDRDANLIQSSVDDDRDGSLIIVDNEDSNFSAQNLQKRTTEEIIPSSVTFSRNYIPNECRAGEMKNNVINQGPSVNDGEQKQSNNTHRRSGNRTEAQRKMEDGKNWLIMNLMAIGGSLSIIKLSDIADSYVNFCQANDQEPLATPVLARLIHSLFPSAEKCRLGARGNQRIHYRNLKFKSDVKITQQQQSTDLSRDVLSKDQSDRESGEKDLQTRHDNQNVQCELLRKECVEQVELDQAKIANEVFDESEADVDNNNKSQNQSKSQTPPQNKETQNIPLQDEENCKAAAKKLSEVLKWITNQSEGHKKALLRDFAHSASCHKAACVPVCMMFRRVRRHVVAAQHSCSVLRLYSMLLRHHVSSCTISKCGLPACPALRATRPVKRSLEQQQHPIKRAAVAQVPGGYRPSSIVLAPRSPGGSLPGSPVNSPPATPDGSPLQGSSNWSIPSGVQYIMVPVMMPVIENTAA